MIMTITVPKPPNKVFVYYLMDYTPENGWVKTMWQHYKHEKGVKMFNKKFENKSIIRNENKQQEY